MTTSAPSPQITAAPDAQTQADPGQTAVAQPASPRSSFEQPHVAGLALFGCAGFGSMFAMRMCDAMLPELSRAFATRPSDVASAISGFAIAYGLMQLLSGPLGDRYGRPRVIGWAAALCGVAALLTSLSMSLQQLTTGRVLMGATAAGVIPLTLAWIGDTVALAQRQVVIARLLSYTIAGVIVGAWAGGALSDTLGWRSAFWVAGTYLLLCAATLLNWLRLRPPPQSNADATSQRGRYLRQVRSLLASRAVQRLYLMTFAEGALVFGVLAFIPANLHQRFAVSLSTAGAIVALFGVGGLLYAHTASRMLRRLSTYRLAAIGGLLLCLGFAGLTVLPHWWWGLPACMASGLGFYMLHSALQVSATQLSDTARGTAVSLFACVLFLGQSAGVSAMAYAYRQHWDAPANLLAGLGLLAVALWFAASGSSAKPAAKPAAPG